MEIKQLKYIVEVDRCKSISQAAENLFISQPALSKHIQSAEDKLGFKIFDRTSAGVQTTADGQSFISQARQVINSMDLLVQSHSQTDRPQVEELKVASTRYATVVKAFLNTYQEKIKDSSYQDLCIVETSSQGVIDKLISGLYGLGVLVTSADNRKNFVESLARYRLTYQPLFNQKAHIQVGKNHPLAGRDQVRSQDLQPYPQATMESDDIASIKPCAEVPHYNPKSVNKRIIINDKATMYQLLTHTQAYYMGMNLEGVFDKDWQIDYIPIMDPDSQLECALIYQENHKFTQLEIDFIDQLKKTLDLQPQA